MSKKNKRYKNKLESSGNSRVEVRNDAEAFSDSFSAAILAALQAQFQR